MNCPVPGARGSMRPEGRGSCGVMILGEAMGDQEYEEGLPFRPSAPAGSVLERAIRKIGADREMFVVWNVLPVQPPANYISPAWEAEAIEWGRELLLEQIQHYRPRCILALGNVAVRAATGLSGDKLGVSHLSGYLLSPFQADMPPVVPCFHPSFLRRGAMGLFGVLLRCLKLAYKVAKDRLQPITPTVPTGYQLYPNEAQAREFLREASASKGLLAYDIETAYSNSEEDAEERPDAIRSVQFSLSPGTGIYMPFRPPYIDVVRELLALGSPKLSWNGWRFDAPLLADNACPVRGVEHDLMWAWHHAQPDLPRGLQFAAAMQGPDIWNPTHSWPFPWKHLDKADPQFYGIVDVDVLQWMISYE